MIPCTRVLPVPSFLKERTTMLQQQRLIRLRVGARVLFCLLVGGPLFAGRRFSNPALSATFINPRVETPADDALKYWTADKMRDAKPAPLPNVDTPDRGKRRSRRPPQRSSPHQA